MSVAADLLGRLGEPVVFKSQARHFSVTGEMTEVEAEVSGVGYPAAYRAAEINNTTILMGDIRLTASLAMRPQPGWSVVVDSTEYRVMSVQPVRKSGADIVYICQIRL